MEKIPRWALWIALVLIALAAAFAIVASVKRIKNERMARKMLDAGKLTVSLSPAEIQQIVSEIKKT
ncbi:MAG: hypothetical protein IPM36_18650 [Lewinellaceae bacterium]|nr:hypothetical protein [Lewinellaceae bacterium]